jgi:hypothetical protein
LLIFYFTIDLFLSILSLGKWWLSPNLFSILTAILFFDKNIPVGLLNPSKVELDLMLFYFSGFDILVL